MVLIFKGPVEDKVVPPPLLTPEGGPTPYLPAVSVVLGECPQVDSHEPQLMKSLLGPIGFRQYALNDAGWADYYWLMFDGVPHHVERKTWGELSDMDAVEEQIWRHLTKNPEAKLSWILEGVAAPDSGGYTTYKEATSRGRMIFVGSSNQHRPMKMVHAWLYQIGKFVEVHYTSCLVSTANLITAMYQSDQKESHTTLARYYNKTTWHPNPQVKNLMAVADGIGPVKAEAIIKEFGTLYAVLSARPEEISRVPGIGMNTAKKILARAGRADV